MAGEASYFLLPFSPLRAGLFRPFCCRKMTSQSDCHTGESVQRQAGERTLTALRVLDSGSVSADRASVFNLFIKKFSSPSLLEEYLRSSPYVMDQRCWAREIDEQDLHWRLLSC